VCKINLVVIVGKSMRESEGVILFGVSGEPRIPIKLVLGVYNISSSTMPPNAVLTLFLYAVAEDFHTLVIE
jgi:hypothetical protein